MSIRYLRGKKSRNSFMGYGNVVFPETVAKTSPSAIKYLEDESIYFYRHEISLRACLRRIKKHNFPKGTIVHLYNWYVGYADVLVFI